MKAEEYLNFINVLEKMKINCRHSYSSSGRRESVAEHSWRLSLMALMLKGEFGELDIDKVIKMCIIHDIGEAVTGDIPCFYKTGSDEATEDTAIQILLSALPMNEQSELNVLFLEMSALETPEAKLYKTLDKMEAIIQHNESDISTWLPLEYELQIRYNIEESERWDFTKELRKKILSDTFYKIKESGTWKEDVYTIYKECFGDRAADSVDFYKKLDYDKANLIPIIDGSSMVSYALVRDNCILLICTAPDFQGKGFGRRAAELAEKCIRLNGYDTITLGCGAGSYLYQGVPCYENADSTGFFAACGYKKKWESIDMTLKLEDYDITSLKLPPSKRDVIYRYAKLDNTSDCDYNGLLDAVKSVESSWVEIFESNPDPVYVAVLQENPSVIVGFCIVSESGFPLYKESSTDNSRMTGGVGCVGVVPDYRECGIGRIMVSRATEELKKKGCKVSYIGYTGLEKWYGSIGYKTYLRFWMGGK